MLSVNALIGFGAGDVLLLSLRSTSTSTSSTINAPADIQKGDLLVLLDQARSISLPSTTIPSGFTNIVNTTDGSSVRQIASYKIADGSEASASLTGMSGNARGKSLAVFKGTIPIRSVVVSSPNSEITSANPSEQNVIASLGSSPLIVFGCYGTDSGPIDPTSFSPEKDGQINSSTESYLAYKIYNSNPMDTQVDMGDQDSHNTLQSFFISCLS